MNLLALDTATESCTVALQAGQAITGRTERVVRRHGDILLDCADALLSDAGMTLEDLDAIGVGRGPGAFTGVRLGLAAAQGLAFAVRKPLVPVSTLEATAVANFDAGLAANVLVCVDARMGEVYWAAFRQRAGGNLDPLGEERVGPPDAVVVDVEAGWLGLGNGFAAYPALRERLDRGLVNVIDDATPDAPALLRLTAAALARGDARDPAAVDAHYLRNQVTQR